MLTSTCQIFIAAENDVITARRHGRAMAQEIGFGRTEEALVATAISELGQNILLHAIRGELSISPLIEKRRTGICVVATDQGPGIQNIEQALEDGFSTHDRSGLGLSGTRRIVDEFDIHSLPGQGTRIRIVKWRLH
jgi:serine/threonine-protein kinase RsbT